MVVLLGHKEEGDVHEVFLPYPYKQMTWFWLMTVTRRVLEKSRFSHHAVFSSLTLNLKIARTRIFYRSVHYQNFRVFFICFQSTGAIPK